MSTKLKVHESSLKYEPNKEVAVDESTWLTVLTNEGTFAYHAARIDYTELAINEHGINVRILKQYYDYVTAENENGESVIFTTIEAAKANEFEFSIRLNKFAKKNHAGFFGNETLLNYHDNRAISNQDTLPTFHEDTDEYLIGVEVEKVDHQLQSKGKAFEILQATGWRKESDGSLSFGGYELVSPRLPLLDNDRISQACIPVMEYINGGSDNTCGGHINISRKNVSSDMLLRKMRGFVPLLYAMYEQRMSNRFCAAKSWSKYFGRYKSKYSAFYLKNNDVLEIRLFSGVKDVNQLMWRIKLLQCAASMYGKNVSSVLLNMSDVNSDLYSVLRLVYSHEQIADKVRLAYKYARLYNVAKIKDEVIEKINTMWGRDVI